MDYNPTLLTQHSYQLLRDLGKEPTELENLFGESAVGVLESIYQGGFLPENLSV